jgi:histidinol dehydrogenase
MIKTISVKSLGNPEVKRLCNRSAGSLEQIIKSVRSIVKEVRLRGDTAVLKYARRYDGLKGRLPITPGELKSQASKCPKTLKTALRRAIRNVRDYHQKQKEKSWKLRSGDQVVLGQIIRPLHRVGVYVPGGMGAYPSTVVMNVIPARIAGVKEIVVVTPVASRLNPLVAFALQELKIKEIYKVGGAQAVAMLAFGTRKVKRVDKIIGPGNNYAALAKKEVFGEVDIDMISGPSEILVMADESADPDWVASDLLSQAEHGSGYEAAVCITNSQKQALFIRECVKQQVESSPKRDLLKKSLSRYGRILVVKDWKLGCELANAIAPETDDGFT